MIDRRTFLAGTGAVLLAAPLAAEAQPAAKVYRIGFLGNSTPALEANLVGPFREGLRKLGYVEGRNIVIEYRWAEGQYERFPVLVAELLARKVDVIVTAGTPATQAVNKATTSVPLVMVAVGDPVVVFELRGAVGGVTYLEGRCLSYGRSIPYLPVLDQEARDLLAIVGDAAPATVYEAAACLLAPPPVESQSSEGA